jgi:ribonucleoside-diphosphate reductase alpha chain
MKIRRHFTADKTGPFHGIEFAPRDCEIRENGKVVFSQAGLIFPKSWSQTACNLTAQKYFRKASDSFEGESDLRQVIHRIAGCWRHWGEKLGYFDTSDDAQSFYDEHCFLLVRQMASPNSPQWFNTGLHFAYAIDSPAQGHYFVDEPSGKALASTSAYERPQVHACFIQSVQDDLVNPMGIMDLWVREARVFKFGSGSGTNFSNLRAEGESLDGAGASSGLMAFLRIGDVAAGSIKSGGVTRRAAKMVCLDLDHPEIVDFVRWKALEEQKVMALVAGSSTAEKVLSEVWHLARNQKLQQGQWQQCTEVFQELGLPLSALEHARELGRQGIARVVSKPFTTDWRGEAYRAVFGQNANLSVRVSDAFLWAVARGQSWELKERKSGHTHSTIPATELWDEIARAAWLSADPGVQFESLIQDWHTCPESGPIRASNPCSEYLFLDDTGCNLASINLLKFWNPETQELDATAFTHTCRLLTIALDISVSMAQYPSREIAERSVAFRTLGLGYANLGSLVMAAGLPYDSDKGRALASGVTSLMAATAWSTSAEMAEALGSFDAFDVNKKHVLRVLKNHAIAAGALSESFDALSVEPQAVDWEHCPSSLVQASRLLWTRAMECAKKTGIRNAQLTAIAPTGTIGLVMDCDTTGIEPEYSLLKQKALAGGGVVFSTNQTIPLALASLRYSTSQISEIGNFFATHSTLKGAPHLRSEHYAVFDCALGTGPSDNAIRPEGHLGMVAAAQPFICGGISKTVSLPKEATVGDVRNIFSLAHSAMVKCVAIYREGSKLSQPLVELGASASSGVTANPEVCFECG